MLIIQTYAKFVMSDIKYLRVEKCFCIFEKKQRAYIFASLLFPSSLIFSSSMLMQIFLPRGHPAPDVPFGLVHIQHLAGLRCQMGIDIEQAFCYVFMHRRFAHPELFRGLPHCRIIVYDVIRNGYRPLFDILLQGLPLQNVFYILCKEGSGYVQIQDLYIKSYSSTSKGSCARISFSTSTPG